MLAASTEELVNKLLNTEGLINKMRFQYLGELQHYRMQTVTKKMQEATIKLQKQQGTEIRVRLFDELVGVDENIRQLLNERIEEVEVQAK